MWRRLLARVLVLMLAVGAVPADCLAGGTPPPPGESTPTLAASIQKAVAMETAKMGKARSSTSAAKQDPGVPVNKLESKSFFKSPAGVPLTITFSAGQGHLASVSIPSLGITQDLTVEGASLTIPAPAPGTYELVCAEGYTDATFVVE